jgi:gamma-glutamyltranspeptidase/glutathione hydrolase
MTQHPRTRRLVALGAAGSTSIAGLALALPSAQAAQGVLAAPGVAPSATAPARVSRAKPHYYTDKVPTSRGFGGAVTSVDPEASKVGIGVLRRGGNAVDAAVATAAALGVTEPYSSGLGGGGYFLYYDARTRTVHSLDGRETAPKSMPDDAFVDPATGKAYPFTPDLVTSGVSVGVPGTPATWNAALRQWGTRRMRNVLVPAERLARRGFKVDDTFRQQTLDNQERFEAFTTTPRLFLPGGTAPRVGSVFRNPDLARTYATLGARGMRSFYTGPIAGQISRLVRTPPRSRSTQLPVPAGYLKRSDFLDYRAVSQAPTRVGYRGYGVFGVGPSSSGGSTVGEALNIMERFDLSSMGTVAALHHYLEATALAFADRKAHLGDPAYVDVPLKHLLSDRFAKERACAIDETRAFATPVDPGNVADYDGSCRTASASAGSAGKETENVETTNLTVADRHGNVVEYTLTIEQTGGSGMLVPGRGFLLNNELTDFSTDYSPTDPNRIQPGKRPRSSISPTIILKNGRPFVALGSPGGSTIITTVTQMIFNRIDRGLSLRRSIAAPRASQQNTPTVSSEPAFLALYGDALTGYGHDLVRVGDGLTSAPEIGAATAIEFGPKGQLTAVAEPARRGGGSALVVRRRR